MLKTDSYKGNLSMFAYAMITALSTLLIHYTTEHIPALLSAFYTFSFCILIYSLTNIAVFKKVYLAKNHIDTIFILNITTAICWIFTFLALQYLPAELYLFLYLCAMPISACFILRKKLIKALGLCFGLIVLVMSYHFDGLYIGTGLAFLGGVSGTIYSIHSKKITHVFSTNDILAVRFYMTVILTFILSVLFYHAHVVLVHYYLQFAVLALISVVIPLTLFQVGLKHLPLNKALSFLPLAPIFCFLLNSMLGYSTWSMQKILAIIFISILMFI